jgi:hypothetical protein
MKQHPILFKPEMVRAILDGRKTQTRRVCKIQPPEPYYRLNTLLDTTQKANKKNIGKYFWDYEYCEPEYFRCPYGEKGSILWVRETTCIAPKRFANPDDSCVKDYDGDLRYVSYKADGHGESAMRDYGLKWTPSIHVPKWAVRLWLKVKDIRVERLQDISEEDALAEGIRLMEPYSTMSGQAFYGVKQGGYDVYAPNAYTSFFRLWDSINGKPRKDGTDISWKANPMVFVTEFEKTDKPKTV